MALHATLSPSSARDNISPEAASRGRDLINSRKLTCPDCGLVTTAGPMARHDCDPSYTAIHFRLVRRRGAAKKHTCVDCGGQAFDWSYDYQDPDDRRSEEGRYSLDLERYVPRCRGCHLNHDIAKDPEFAASRQASGEALAATGLGAAATARKWGK